MRPHETACGGRPSRRARGNVLSPRALPGAAMPPGAAPGSQQQNTGCGASRLAKLREADGTSASSVGHSHPVTRFAASHGGGEGSPDPLRLPRDVSLP